MSESTAALLLDSWLAARLSKGAAEWLRARCGATCGRGADAAFYMALSSAPRHVGRAELALDESERTAADAARSGWRPARWSVDQAARTLLVLSLPASDARQYLATLDRLFDDGDLGELVVLYQALPLLPHPEAHRRRAAEGVRSNMQAVFEAVALDNPYPAEELDADAWNQLVLKCLFVESPLYRVRGLEQRQNAALAKMLSDYAHERWAAKRAVSLELWRCLGPLAQGALLEDLRRVLETGTEAERLAAALSCARNEKAAELRAAFPEVFDRVDRNPPTWAALAGGQP